MKLKKKLEYNYRDLQLSDLRYRGNDGKGYYILSFKHQRKDIYPININKSIFETILYKYFTPMFNYTREDLFKLKWCAYLSEGCYYKYREFTNDYEEQEGSTSRVYVSRLEVQGILDGLTYHEKQTEENEMHNIH